jgi:phosphatidylglycerophosphate synthase
MSGPINIVQARDRVIEALGVDRATNLLVRYNHTMLVKQLPNALSLSRFELARRAHSQFIPKLTGKRANFRSARRDLWGLLALTAATDVLDGQVAVRCEVSSQVGAMLDPAGDKAVAMVLYAEYVKVIEQYASPAKVNRVRRAIKVRIWLDGLLVVLALLGGLLGMRGRANHYGKIKFTLDVVGMLLAYETLMRSEGEKEKANLSANIMAASAWGASSFAALSIIEHLRRPEQ